MRNFKIWIGAFATALAGGSALAADMPVTKGPIEAPSEWLLTLGIGAEAVNQFPGSKTYTAAPNGVISRWHAGDPEPFIAPDDSFGVDLLDFNGFRFGPVGNYIQQRGLSGGNGNFFGLHNVGWSVELGVFGEYWITNFIRTHLEIRQAINGNRGLEANLSIDGVYRTGPWTLSAGPRVGYGDQTFMKAYYSVSPLEASINPFVTPYNAGSGIDKVGALVSARYDFNRSWNTTVFGGYNRLVGPAGWSPIPNKLGSRDDFTGGATIAYTFAWGGFGILGF